MIDSGLSTQICLRKKQTTGRRSSPNIIYLAPYGLAQVSWYQRRNEAQVWPAGALRLVFPGTELADFQAFAAVGKHRQGR